MKDQINLLPPLAKRERMQRLFRRRLRYIARRGLLGLVVIWMTLAGVGWMTWQRHQEMAAAMAAQNQNGGEVFQEVAHVNELMNVIEAWVAAHPAVTPFLDDIVRTLPAEARLTVLALQAEGGGLVVKGVSPSRGAVLDMQRKLEGLPWVERVEAPLQNFAVDSRGEFSFTLFRRVKE